MKKFLSLLILILAFAAAAFAQETKDDSKKPVEWVRVENNTGEFSVEMPSDFVYFYDKNGFSYDIYRKSFDFNEMQMLNAAMEKTVMGVEIYKVSSPKKHLDELADRLTVKGSKTSEPMDGFTIKRFEQKSVSDWVNKKDVEISFITKFIASKTHLYVVTVANRGAQSQIAMRFLASIRLNKERAASSDTTKVVNISSLNPVTIEQIHDKAQLDKTKPDETNRLSNPIEKIENPALFLSRPAATYNEAGRQAMTNGSVRLRVTFAKDGRVSKIRIISGLENGLTRNAFFSALRIKFIPQEKENELTTVTKVVEYTFSIG